MSAASLGLQSCLPHSLLACTADWVLPFLACTAACLPQCWPIQLTDVFSPGLHNWLSPAVSACTAGHFLPFLGAASHLMLHLLCISGGWLAWCSSCHILYWSSGKLSPPCKATTPVPSPP